MGVLAGGGAAASRSGISAVSGIVSQYFLGISRVMARGLVRLGLKMWV